MLVTGLLRGQSYTFHVPTKEWCHDVRRDTQRTPQKGIGRVGEDRTHLVFPPPSTNGSSFFFLPFFFWFCVNSRNKIWAIFIPAKYAGVSNTIKH